MYILRFSLLLSVASPSVLASEIIIRETRGNTNAGGYASCCTDPFADAPLGLAHHVVLVLVSFFLCYCKAHARPGASCGEGRMLTMPRCTFWILLGDLAGGNKQRGLLTCVRILREARKS